MSVALRPCRLPLRPPALPRRAAQCKAKSSQSSRPSASRLNLNAGASGLKLFLDTADREQWRTYFRTGVFWGITTNPTILERDGVKCNTDSLRELARDAFDCGAQEILMQAWGETADEMVAVGRQLASLDPRINVKVPITKEGVEAGKALLEDKVPLCMTAVYSAHQALTAAALGATYAAPYLGRMNDAKRDGLSKIITMNRLLDEADSPMEIMVASIRDAEDMAILAAEGLNVFTFSPAVAAQLFEDELTLAAAADFHAAAVRNT